jgi:hypothetical protein
VVTATTPTVRATEEAPASSQTRSEVFELVLHGSRFTIHLFYQFGTDSPNCYQKANRGFLPKKEHFTGFFPSIGVFYSVQIAPGTVQFSAFFARADRFRVLGWSGDIRSARRTTACSATFPAPPGLLDGVSFLFRRLSH